MNSGAQSVPADPRLLLACCSPLGARQSMATASRPETIQSARFTLGNPATTSTSSASPAGAAYATFDKHPLGIRGRLLTRSNPPRTPPSTSAPTNSAPALTSPADASPLRQSPHRPRRPTTSPATSPTSPKLYTVAAGRLQSHPNHHPPRRLRTPELAQLPPPSRHPPPHAQLFTNRAAYHSASSPRPR